MPSTDLLREGERVMTVCNACRYCEGYCAVFPAMEQRLTFTHGDLRYLANLCHDCGECLYACPYAPPHEFGINVPRTLAQIRLSSYETFAWPGTLSKAFRHQRVQTVLGLSAAFALLMLTLVPVFGGNGLAPIRGAEFYQAIPHHVMVGVFGGVFGFVSIALGIGFIRFWRDAKETPAAFGAPRGGARVQALALTDALRDVLTLKYLHASGPDCTYPSEETRSPWRRRFHHCTYYGFLLCFGATSVAAVYHLVFGWKAPYAYTSVPVVLGTAGGIGLLIGPAGLLWLRRRTDQVTGDPAQQDLDVSFSVLLLLSSLTGLLLLVFRATAAMTLLLVIHLGVVLALFITLPYGKFVHGVYRSAALIKYALACRRADDAL